MSSMTKAQLVDELAKLRHNYELMEQKCIAIANDMSAMSVQRDVAESKLEDAEQFVAAFSMERDASESHIRHLEDTLQLERNATEIKVRHLEDVLRSYGIAQRYVAVCGKSDESPAYISESFDTEQKALDAAFASGYPIVDVDAVFEKANPVETKPERVRHGHALIRRKVFEFDPSIPGDFQRASEQARAQGGITRRIDSRNH